MKRVNEYLINGAVVLGTVLIVFFLIEIALRFVVTVRLDERLIEVRPPSAQYCLGDCYTSDPGKTFPIDLRVEVEKHPEMAGSAFGTLAKVAPYCVFYDCVRRKQGFFEGRPREAALVGDSFTFGIGVRDEASLGALMGMAWPDTNFRNYGQRGVNVGEVNGLMQKALLEVPEASAVIYFYNLNDVFMAPAVAARQKFITDFQSVRVQNIKDQSGWNAVFGWSRLYQVVARVFIMRHESELTVQNYLDMYLSKENEAHFLQTREQLSAMVRQAKAAGKEFYVVIYPLLYKDMQGKYPFTPIHEVMMEACRASGAHCFDGAQAFNDIRNMKNFVVHKIDSHPNAEANKRMIGWLFGQMSGKSF